MELSEDQLIYFAILNWIESNRPYSYPEGGYVFDIKSARSKFANELMQTTPDEFSKLHNIDQFFKPKKEKRMAWTDEKKAEVVKAYLIATPTPETSIEIVKQIAEDFEETPNGVRMILSKEGVYVKKEVATSSGTSTAKTTGTRVSKADSIQGLKDVIEAAGQAVDDEVLDKLTGKQAVYLTEVFKKLIK